MATRDDAALASELARNTIRGSNSQDYDQRTIDLICSHFSPQGVLERIENEDIVLCYLDGELVGMAGLRKNTLRSTFVDPAFQGRGLGKKLVAHIERIARKKGLSSIAVNSSITARRFYESLGFQSVDYRQHSEGSTYRMKKKLDE